MPKPKILEWLSEAGVQPAASPEDAWALARLLAGLPRRILGVTLSLGLRG